MLTSRSTVFESFPALQQLDAKDRDWLVKQVQVQHFPAGTRLFYEGESCAGFLLLLKGSMRVQKLTDNGHEIVLYHVLPGQSCKLTNSCLLGGQRYPAEAFSETEVELLTIPKAAFKQLLEKSPQLRNAIYSSIDDAMSELVTLVEEVAFGHLDHRLAQFLLECTRQQPRLQTTHQAVATELGTAREVISRLLKEFERNGWLKLHRGSIEITDRAALGAI
ncbi:hypothetical protein Tel_08190 [Candidatus Tenderia electrophaga]|jgi:CRP/FNR family transcriptional regulator|uniref:Crp/Fnr family transcriptional regulator n=1 Tax=Candidatus Tenderia electrophaga TaxID=1748243 RepID=A0A0S2TD98_9GAMM|nr:hypothetical protein Tel_08190 [Candidatus Tenderia electrophaga]